MSLDVVEEDMQRVAVTEEHAKDRLRWRQMTYWSSQDNNAVIK